MEIADIPLVAGHPALDFLNALEERATPAEVNYLPGYEHLLRWSARVGLVTERTQRALLRAAADHPTKAKKVWAAAMDLRRALDAIFRTARQGQAAAGGCAARAERHACRGARAAPAAAASGRRDGLALGGRRRWRSRRGRSRSSAAALLTDEDRCARIRICGNPACDWMFLDDSRTGQRRWCRMNVCGNEAKVRRFRERQRAER